MSLSISKWRALILLTIVLVLAAAWISWEQRGITLKNFEKIRLGMSQAEVEALLGQAASPSHCGFSGAFYYSLETTLPSPLTKRTCITIYYDDTGVCQAFVAEGGYEWWERFSDYFELRPEFEKGEIYGHFQGALLAR